MKVDSNLLRSKPLTVEEAREAADRLCGRKIEPGDPDHGRTAPRPLPTSGWICPKCGRVMAPHMIECLNCNLATHQPMEPLPGIPQVFGAGGSSSAGMPQ